jgi:hypothetical protein
MLALRDTQSCGLPVAERFKGPLLRCARGDLPPNVALMQLFAAAQSFDEARSALQAELVRRKSGGSPAEAGRIQRALALCGRDADAWRLVKATLGELDHQRTGDTERMIADCAGAFDRAAAAAEDAGAALYTLGSAELLQAATAEIVTLMRQWRLLGRDRSLLEIGCGAGRCMAAVAADAGLVVGTFPYIAQAGIGLAAEHIREAARVLKASGSLVIMNFSYRGDDARDRADVSRMAQEAALEVMHDGSRPFAWWDGFVFRLQKPGEDRSLEAPRSSPSSC